MSNKQIVLDKIVDDFVDSIVEYFTRTKLYVSISESKLKNIQFIIEKKIAILSSSSHEQLFETLNKNV